jgi:hypothetical protein
MIGYEDPETGEFIELYSSRNTMMQDMLQTGMSRWDAEKKEAVPMTREEIMNMNFYVSAKDGT